jgi:Tfp pilus assembly protein FimT
LLNQIAAIHSTTGGGGGIPVSGYSLWLDASDANTFSYSSGSVVSQWNDKSANAYNLTQGTVGYQPTRQTNVQNGLPAVAFGNKFMANSSVAWGASSTTLFIVAKEDKSLGTNFQNIVTTGTGATGQWGYGITSDGTSEYLAIFDIGQGYSAFNTVMTNGNSDVLAFKSAGISSGSVTSSMWKNGTAAAVQPATLNNTTSATGFQIGAAASASEPFFGWICEIILYPSQLSDTDRVSVQDYLKTKWGTP